MKPFLERGKRRKERLREREYGEIKWRRGIETETSPLSSVTASHLSILKRPTVGAEAWGPGLVDTQFTAQS